jgi:hypothetical protein
MDPIFPVQEFNCAAGRKQCHSWVAFGSRMVFRRDILIFSVPKNKQRDHLLLMGFLKEAAVPPEGAAASG